MSFGHIPEPVAGLGSESRPRQRWAWSWRSGQHRRSGLKRQLVSLSSTVCILEVPRAQLADRAERVRQLRCSSAACLHP